ncbi:MAG: hypothetical protein K2M00_02760, partial [Muribaculaceae bacterium]|nr:hypothetical protein [Muribaculaceae bacterium]
MEDLEIMREQLAAVKRRLDTQQIVNNKLMRKIMRHKAAWLNKFVTGEMIALPVVFILFAILCAGYGISIWYAIAFLIIAGIDTAVDRRTVRIPPHMFSDASIVELKKLLIRQKKERFIQTCVALPACVIWLVAFFIAAAANTNISVSDDFTQALRTGGLFGGIAGGVIVEIAAFI